MAGDDGLFDQKLPRTAAPGGGYSTRSSEGEYQNVARADARRPHYPRASKDGAIWWTGQLSNKLGRIDPKTGAIREYTLKSAFSGPHGLAEDKGGNIWFTGNNLIASSI
jgi:streptogramin lyase